MKTSIIFFLTFISIISDGQKSSPNKDVLTNFSYNSRTIDLIDVSIINLISTPEKYHHKEIRLIGYLNLEFEGDAIYLHKEDFDRSIVSNAFWVNFSKEITKTQKDKCSKKYVIIEGTFDMNSHGHMGLFSGTINNITRLDQWAGRQDR